MEERNPVGGVLQKLEEHITGEAAINARAHRVGNIVTEFVDFSKGKQENDVVGYFQIYLERQRSLPLEWENTMAAYLFFLNRRFVGETFSAEKEKRQIKAAVSLLSGYHVRPDKGTPYDVHMGTGEGKSSAVLSIVAIVEALRSREQNVILATATESLLADLEAYTKKFLGELERTAALPADFSIFLEKPEEPAAPQHDELQKTMIREALAHQSYSEETKENIRNAFWEDVLLKPHKKMGDFLDKPVEAGKRRRITLVNERRLVFAYEEDPIKFREKAPNIYIDEADVSYRRGSPYIQNQKEVYFSPEDVIDSASMWMINYLVAKTINPKQDFELKDGSWRLKDNADIDKRVLSRLTVQDEYFRAGVGIICRQLELDESEQNAVAQRLQLNLDRLKGLNPVEVFGFPPKAKEKVADDLAKKIVDIGQTMARLYYESGGYYLFDKTTGVDKVRDQYLGRMIEGHEFYPETRLAIYALNESFRFIPLVRQASQTLRYQTFIWDMADRIHCASGSLFFPDPITQKIKQDPFAYFLEHSAGHRVALITPLEIKKLPDPQVFIADEIADEEDEEAADKQQRLTGNEKAIIKLVEDCQQTKEKQQPHLIISWYEGEALEIYQALKKKFGSERVGLVPSSGMSAEEEKAIYRDLADGRIDFVISSGAAGIGIDIKKSSGVFPDLKVSLFNLPQTRAQISQALGRRRLPGEDFSWYVSDSSLLKTMSYLKKRGSRLEKLFGVLDIETVAGIARPSVTPAKRQKIIMRLLENSEKQLAADDELTILVDQFMRIINSGANQFVENYLKPSVSKKKLPWYASVYGIPDLSDNIFSRLQLITRYNTTIKQLVETGLPDHLEQNPIVLDEWMEEKKMHVDEYASIVWWDKRILTGDHVKAIQFIDLGPAAVSIFQPADPETGVQEYVGWGHIEKEGEDYLVYKDTTGKIFVPRQLMPDGAASSFLDYQVIHPLTYQLEIREIKENVFLLFCLTNLLPAT